jgi:recombination protein RecA
MSKKFNLQTFKESIKATELPYKPDSFIDWGSALSAISGLPGFPMGHVMQCYGPSNGGKSSLGFHLAAKAQKQGVLPIFIITEGKMSTDRATAMGVNLDEAIIVHATYIEEVFEQVHKFLTFQNKGELPKDLFFIVDSIGNTISRDSVKTGKDGTTEVGGAMMKVSRVIREQMRVVSHKINDTRRVNSPKFAGLFFINHSYKQPPQFPGGPTLDVPYGGDGIYYSSSLVIKVKKTKQIKAAKAGIDYSFGISAKLSVEKNHITGVSNTGEFVIVPDAIIPNEPGAIKDYKELKKDTWGQADIMGEDGEVLE